ncbi:MAG: carbonic anhydrase [Pseudomonadota bacterium]|nr:carbonic anhydrase [Pseudomonadota bacterium]MDE3038226.1 carbonic anhydrase [Pseudomonadota bacterium]
MTRDIIDDIRSKQQSHQSSEGSISPPKHDPEMLYIGCVDARLDPVADIGIEQGRALIHRNVGALVPEMRNSVDGVITASDEMGGVLELFLDILERDKNPDKIKKKHIVVSGHTHCGGINACACHKAMPGGFLERYLSAFSGVVSGIFGQERSNSNPSENKLRELEEESVRQSVRNLRSYGIVQDAERKGLVELHGWMIDTATKHISELHKDGQFVRMDLPQTRPNRNRLGHGDSGSQSRG